MTGDELNAKYATASWVIARRSASAAGKAMMFSSESVEDTAREIAAVYGLSDEEISRLQPYGESGAVASVQRFTNSLLGNGTEASASQAVAVAKTALKTGRTAKVLATLFKAGPAAAKAAATSGQVAGKSTPWGWIATAGYAAGSAGWFAYNARAFNLTVYELVREREGIELITAPEIPVPSGETLERLTFEVSVPTFGALRAQTKKAAISTGNTLGRLFRRANAQPLSADAESNDRVAESN